MAQAGLLNEDGKWAETAASARGVNGLSSPAHFSILP